MRSGLIPGPPERDLELSPPNTLMTARTEKKSRRFFAGSPECLDIQIGDIKCIGLDEFTPRFDDITHER